MRVFRFLMPVVSLSAFSLSAACESPTDKSTATPAPSDTAEDDNSDNSDNSDDDSDDSDDDSDEPEVIVASLTAVPDTGGVLTELSAEAVAVSPAWVRDDLTIAFLRLRNSDADELAALIVDLDEPWLIDEVAFSVAHTSVEMLDARHFHPQLLVDNARYIYEVDPYLSYVDLVETGEAGVDDDWTTTVVYQVQDGPSDDGSIIEAELPPELYYWYVVHPRIEDESTYYIDAWLACRSTGLECPADPDEGSFWRAFLWEAAATQCPDDDYCPVLADFLPDAEVLWSTEGGGTGAIGEVAAFMHTANEAAERWLTFGASGERSIQPVRIYALGRGNCGEWADMTTALARTSLIPNMNVTPASWDHTWNEFYDPVGERWVAWEPVNWWFDHGYGAPYANYATRGDTRVTHVTDRYADTFDLEVNVVDIDGLPVDGASVVLWSPNDTSWWYAGEGATDIDGQLTVPLTASQSFAVRVESPIGNLPAADNTIDHATDGAVAGDTDTITLTIDASAQLGGTRTLLDDGLDPLVGLEVSGDSRDARTIGESFRFGGHTYTQSGGIPLLSWFVTDSAGYEAFLNNDDHHVFAENDLSGETATSLGAVDDRVLVLVNDQTVSTYIFADWTVALTTSDGIPIAELTQSVVLAPGDHQAIAVVPE